METYSFTGALGRDEDAIIDVCLFEDLPFSDEHTVIYQWRAGDIMNVLIDEGHLKQEDVNGFTKIMSVRVNRYYTMDIDALDDESQFENIDGDLKPKAVLQSIYTVGVSKMTTHIMAGRNFEIEDMDRKMRDTKLNRIL